jgi:hypothetical protein
MTLMTPSEALVETLVARGVKDVFGIVGSEPRFGVVQDVRVAASGGR